MTDYSLPPQAPFYKRSNLPVAIAILIVELIVISILYKNNFKFTCRDVAPDVFCAFAGHIVPRGLGVLAALTLFAVANATLVRDLLRKQGGQRTGLTTNLLGFGLALTPWFFVSDASGPAAVTVGVLFWLTGAVLAAIGLCLLIATWSAWKKLVVDKGLILAALLLIGMLLPEMAAQMKYIWRTEWLTELTFDAVVRVLVSVGYVIDSHPPQKVIGIVDADPEQSFYIAVGAPCAGLEGFLLISVFLSVYLWLFRRDLAFPNAFLLFPIGILVSWAFNVTRISGLLSLGYHTSPQHAVNGFHSHAGWFSFTVLTLLLIFAARQVPFFNKSEPIAKPHREAIPFFNDPTAAQLLPFAVFMLSGLVASTFFEIPGLAYPFRVAAMGLALVLFWRVLRALPWRIDPTALGSGLAIGVAWIATAPEASGPPPFGPLAGGLLLLWIVTRVIGTSLFVPLIEELVFRGYLLDRLAPAGKGARMVLAIVLSAALFGALHDRWIAAALAGLVFGALVYRSGNVTDPIISHAGANATIALWALVTGAWHIL